MKSSEELNAINAKPEVQMHQEASFSWNLLGLYALLICPFIIAYPQNSSIFYMLSRGMQLLCVTIWLTLQFYNNLRISLENKIFVYSVHAWWIFLICNTFMQVPTRQFTLIYYWITIWNILLIAKLYMTRDFVRHLYHVGILFSFLVYLNVILYVLFPDGLWVDTEWLGNGDKTRYLFGNYNQTGIVGLIALLIWGAYTFLTGRGYKNMFWLMVCNLGVVAIMGSMTSTVGILIICLYFLLHKRIKHPFRWVSIFFTLYILFFVIIVWQGKNLQEWPLLTDFVVNVLHKNITFTHRTYLWFSSVKLIMDSPIIGYGARDVEWMIKAIGGSGPHNIWLLMLLEGGLVSFTLLVNMFVVIFRSLRKRHDVVGSYVAVCISVLLLMSLFETYNTICFFFILIIAYYMRYAKKEQEEIPTLNDTENE